MVIHQDTPILDYPYERRRVIVVVQTVAPPPGKESGVDGAAMFGAAAAGAAGVAGAVGADAALAFIPFVGWVVAGAALATLLVKLAKERKSAPFLPVAIDRAKVELTMPPGHPQVEHAYAAHPLAPARYVPLATFHRAMFVEKVNEVVKLLASLGAKRVRAIHREGYQSDGAFEAGASVKGQRGPRSASAKSKWTSTRGRGAVFEEHYRPQGKPEVPEGLLWFGHETAWQGLAERRLKFGMTRFKIQLEYNESFGIDAKVKASLDGLGLDLGGHFASFESTIWELDGEFA